MKAETKSPWVNFKRTASYNALFNFLYGSRGVGKTYGALEWQITHHLTAIRNGAEPWEFVYLRRLKTELKKLTSQQNGRLFDAIQKQFPDHNLKAEGDVLTCDNRLLGYGIALSTASTLKSDNFVNVKEIIFDEFIIDNTRIYHYLPDEVTKFLDAYETIARPMKNSTRKPVRVWFLANAVTINNPYFTEWNLYPPQNGDIQRFGKTKDMLVQNCRNELHSELKKSSRFGQMIAGTHYADYAYDNEWLLDDTSFVESKPQSALYYMSLRYKSNWLGIWFDPLQMVYYVSKDYDKQYPVKYSATTNDHRPNTLLFSRGKSQPYIKTIIAAYERGAMRYESVKLKAWFRDIIRMSWGA